MGERAWLTTTRQVSYITCGSWGSWEHAPAHVTHTCFQGCARGRWRTRPSMLTAVLTATDNDPSQAPFPNRRCCYPSGFDASIRCVSAGSNQATYAYDEPGRVRHRHPLMMVRRACPFRRPRGYRPIGTRSANITEGGRRTAYMAAIGGGHLPECNLLRRSLDVP